jgi:hypothetical protein
MRKIPDLELIDRTGSSDEEVARTMLMGLFPSI